MEFDKIELLSLKGVGEKTVKLFAKLNLKYVNDLLFHLPIRYEDKTKITDFKDIKHSYYHVLQGKVIHKKINYTKRKILIITIADKNSSVNLFFFNYIEEINKSILLDDELRVYGQLRLDGQGGYSIVQPEYKRLRNSEDFILEKKLTPVYPTTKGLSQKIIKKQISQAFVLLKKNQSLQKELIISNSKVSLYNALYNIHFPSPKSDLYLISDRKDIYSKRLIFEELLIYYLSIKQLKLERINKGNVFKVNNDLYKKIITGLSFELTKAQTRILNDIDADLQSGRSMLRLVQGDVGSGKTIVAALATSSVITKGCQAAIMAPTELLAEQHYKNFKCWYEPHSINVALLCSSKSAKEKKVILTDLVSGKIDLLIGTHALFQDAVKFKKLAMIVIDEQHRFGVEQRMLLKNKGKNYDLHVHQLIMTATPIPRSLAMTMYSQLDISIIDELPPGRQEITTIALSQQKRSDIIERVSKVCKEGKQVYWVCTLIEESELLEAKAATEILEVLQELLPDLKIALIHGKQKAVEKEKTMEEFKDAKIDMLVSTTVIEVGVDVPNATLMIIENPERLGLSQLHQLRGRVGRGAQKSHCVLLYKSPLSKMAKERIKTMRSTNDGFIVAEKDFELRGAGELLGTKQTGDIGFKISELKRDEYMLEEIKNYARNLSTEEEQEFLSNRELWINNAEEYSEV